MEDNEFSYFWKNYGGLIVGIIIGLMIYSFDLLHKFFSFIFIVLVSALIGNYVQKNKTKVKETLKNFIDRI